MNTIAQHVAPEEVMALLDGELAAAEAQAASQHLEDCPECAKLADRLRTTSQSLSAWKVPAIPRQLEDSVTELAAKVASGAQIRKPKLFVRASFWSWKQWTALSGAAAAALLFVIALSIPPGLASRARSQDILSSLGVVSEQNTRGEGRGVDTYRTDPGVAGGRDRDSLQMNEKGSAGKRDKGGSAGILGGVPGGIPGGAMGGVLGGLPRMAKTPQVEVRNGQPQVAENQISAPMIARTVSLSIVVKDFAAARSSLDAILARYHGYSAQLSASTTENAPRALHASLRIPAPALSPAINDLKTLGRVQQETQSGEEVTRQHEDLVACLKNSRNTEQRLRDILQHRTGKLSDVLEVEEEIGRVRGEIEEIQTEQKALEHRVDFATIELQLAEEYKAQLNPPATSVSTRIHNAFVAGYQNASETLLGIFLWFAEYSPTLLIWLAILAVPFVMIWRRYRRVSAAL
jgi:hypothetical protein